MNSKCTKWCRAAGNVVALLAGARATDVWSDYETFEEDMSTLFDTVEDVYGSAKWFLEERERAKVRREVDEAESHVVPVAGTNNLDDQGPQKVQSNGRVVVQERVDNLREEEQPLTMGQPHASPQTDVTGLSVDAGREKVSRSRSRNG